ncbi:MAG: LysR family transcriptional regulator [Paracoccus sp. (in: a-proteobacteria)]|uniref:LysR family transcriptional regulator n=1 Tax=Paracoccus sp. TaxID=267 RepID=UPI0026DF12BF|nr:LysR family transcriptional regulator [Paracoccus sp. (in: a-proteobacteria)]MDO5614080.1 LysR family transcriptional regulator [Paracoccus sp. (in: a-proteobacteria)]
MARDTIHDLRAFLAVARESSFTRAAAILGVSPSALSHAMRQLEERLGLRLLMRTTRSVSLTQAGERLFKGISPHFEGIEAQIEALGDLRDSPAGTIRITASDYPIRQVLWPKLIPFLRANPDIRVDLEFSNAFVDIVAERFDAGVRMGEALAKDMISARISADLRFAVVGAPSYFADHPAPQTLADLADHRCINLRLPTHGGLWAWDFEQDGKEVRVRVDGQLTFSSVYEMRDAAVAGFGLTYVPEDIVADHLADGRLTRVLDAFCPAWDGYHIYYPSRRQSSPAFTALVEALRHRG